MPIIVHLSIFQLEHKGVVDWCNYFKQRQCTFGLSYQGFSVFNQMVTGEIRE